MQKVAGGVGVVEVGGRSGGCIPILRAQRACSAGGGCKWAAGGWQCREHLGHSPAHPAPSASLQAGKHWLEVWAQSLLHQSVSILCMPTNQPPHTLAMSTHHSPPCTPRPPHYRHLPAGTPHSRPPVRRRAQWQFGGQQGNVALPQPWLRSPTFQQQTEKGGPAHTHLAAVPGRLVVTVAGGDKAQHCRAGWAVNAKMVGEEHAFSGSWACMQPDKAAQGAWPDALRQELCSTSRHFPCSAQRSRGSCAPASSCGSLVSTP